MAPSVGKGNAMMVVLFWGFFVVGFLVMLIMIVSVFRAVWPGRKDADHWEALEDKSSILRR